MRPKALNRLVLNLFLAATSTTSTPLSNKHATTRFFFSFGDSFTQTEFNISSTKPSPANIFGNPPYPGVTTDNGANWIEVIVESLAPPVTLSYDFAFSGSVVDGSLVAPFIPSVLTLVNQTSVFIENLASRPSFAPWTSENSAFAFWFGVNDIQNSYLDDQDKLVLHNEIITSYFHQVDRLLEAGGRNFIFLNVPPIQKTPIQVALGPNMTTNQAIQIANFNSLLISKLAAWTASVSHTGVKSYLYDTQIPFNRALADPTAFGASSNVTCFNMDGVSCLWWNNFHPGQAIQKLVGEGVFEVLQDGGFF